MYRFVVLAAMLSTLGATSTMTPTTLSVRQAMAECAKTLGSVHFDHGQAMVFASSGVNESVATGDSGGGQQIIFQSQKTGGKATFTVNAHKRQIDVKHRLVRSRGRLTCILPD